MPAIHNFMSCLFAELAPRTSPGRRGAAAGVVVGAAACWFIGVVAGVVVAAATRAVVAAISLKVATPTPTGAGLSLVTAPTATTTRGSIGRGLAKVGAVKKTEAGIKAQELAVELLNRDRFHPSRKRRDDMEYVQSGKNFGDDLRIGERGGGAGNFICKTFNFAKVFSHCHITFLKIGQLDAGIYGLSLTLSSKHGMDGMLNFGRRL